MEILTLHTHQGINDLYPKSCAYGKIYTGRQMLQIVCQMHQIEYNESILLKAFPEENVEIIINLDRTLEEQEIQDQDHIFIIEPINTESIQSIPILPNGLELPPLNNVGFGLPFLMPPAAADLSFGSVPNAPFQLPPPPGALQMSLDFGTAPGFIMPPLQPSLINSNFGSENMMQLNRDIPIQLEQVDNFFSPEVNSNSLNIRGRSNSELEIQIKNFSADFEDSSTDLYSIAQSDKANVVTLLTKNPQSNSSTAINITYKNDFSFAQVVQSAKENLGMRTDSYEILIDFSENFKEWFDHGKFLEDYNVFSDTTLNILKAKQSITIKGLDNESVKMIIDVTNKVSQIIEYYAQDNNIDDVEGYALFTKTKVNNKRTLIPLRSDMDIPSQSFDFSHLVFKRRFFMISGELLSTEYKLYRTYKDIVDELSSNKNIYMTREEAVALTAYRAIAESENSEITLETETHNLVPKRFKHQKIRTSHCVKFIGDRQLTDVDAMIEYIKIARLIPGLGAFVFKVEANERHAMLIVTPFEIILNGTNGEETIINFKQVVKVESYGSNAVISYSRNHKLISFTVVSNQMPEIEYCINTYNQLIRNTILKRAEEFLQDPTKNKASSTSLIHLNTMMGFDNKTSSTFEYDINLTGRMILEKAISNLNVRGDVNDFALLSESDSERKWLKLDDPVLLQEVYDGCILHVMPRNHIVNINLPDGSVQTLTFAFTLTCDEIIELVFKAINQEFTFGFALYNNGVPMSGELSLPEQTDVFADLYFQRRFFVISRDDIRTPTLQNFAFADCRRYLLNENLDISEDVAATCSAFMLLISEITIEDFKNMKDSYLKANYVPKLVKVTLPLRQEIAAKMKENAKKDRRHMIKTFIRLAREINFFGTESYSVEFRDITRQMQFNVRKYTTGIVRVGLNIITIIDSTSKSSIKILFKDIAKLIKRGGNIFLEFNSRSRLKQFEIKCEKHGQLYDMIISSVRIFKSIIKDRRKKDEENAREEKSRLDGTFMDIDGEHPPQIDVYVYKDLSNRDHSNLMWFDIDCTQEKLLSKAMEKLNITPKPEDRYGVMLRRQDGVTSWLKPGMIFSDIKPQRKSSIYIVPQFLPIKIDSLLGLSKTIEIDLSKKITNLITPITQEFGINVPYGYSLWTEGKALDLRKTIPEQTHNLSTLVLRRRFFPVYRDKNTSIGEIIQCYAEMTEIVKKGLLEFSVQQAISMAYYELVVTHGVKLTKNLIPSDLTVYLPPSIPSNRSIQKEVVKLFKTKKISEEDARTEYIKIVRSNPKFAHEEYQISNNVNDMLLTVTPEWINVANLVSKKDIAKISYDALLNITGVDNRIMIVYSERGTYHRSIFFTSNEVDQIIYVVRSYAQIRKEMIIDAAQNAIFDNNNVIGSEYRAYSDISYGDNSPQRLIYDLRMPTEMVIDKAVRFLKLERTKKYSILMKYNNQDSKWLTKQKPVGVWHPFDGIRMVIFDQNPHITVVYREVQYKVTIKVSSSIESIVEMLGYRFGLWSDIGYTLFIKENDEMVPLTLNESIPEQTTLDRLFYFDRQYYIVTQYDLSTPFVLMPQMEDFKRYIMSGAVSLRDRDLIELIACDLYAHARSPMDVKENVINDITPYLPKGYETSRDLVSRLNKLIQSSAAMNSINAAQQYILTARDLEGFSSKVFKVQMLSENSSGGSEYIDVKMYINTVSVKFKDMKGTCLIKVSLKKIISIVEAKVVMQIRVQRQDGTMVVIQIQSSDCSAISSYLNIICNNIIPKIIEREELQKNRIAAETRNEEDLPISVITKPTADPVPIYIPMQMFGQEIIDFLAKVFFIKDYKDHQVFTLQNSNKKILQEDMSILSLNVNPGDIIYFISTTVNVMITFLDTVYDLNINITSTVAEICIDIAKQLNIGSPEGFTLYVNDGKSLTPLNTYDFILSQTKSIWNLEIRRRFYNFTSGFFEDPRSVQVLYQDVKRSFLKGHIHASKDVIIHLAMLLIFCDLRDTWIFENDMKATKALFPENFNLDENTYQQFKMAMKNYKQTSDMVSITEFLSECVMLNGYGSEEYSINFAGNDINKQKEGKIILSPFNIRIVSPMNDKVHLTILYKNIIQFLSIDDYTYMIKYCDANSMIESVKIIGDTSIPEIINTYITGVLNIKESIHFLYTAEEYREGILHSFPEHIESSNHLIQSSGGVDPLMLNMNGILNFNDLSDIYFQQIESIIPDQDYIISLPNNEMFEFNFNTPDYGNSYLTENTQTDAISGIVALKSLNAIQNFLDQINQSLNSMVPFEYDTIVNQITDIFNSINIERDDQSVLDMIEQINDLIQEMKIIANDTFSARCDTIEAFSERINNTINTLSQKLTQTSSMINGTINGTIDIPVVEAILSVVSSEANLAVAIMGCKRFISNAESIYLIIYNSALSFVNIASTITSESEIEYIDQMILPHITGLSQIIHRVTDICESNDRILDPSSLQQALKETSADYDNLTAIISPKNEGADSNELPIQKTATNIKEAIRVLRELASRLPTNIASELMSSQYYLSQSVNILRTLSGSSEISQYVAQKAMFVLRDQIKQLNSYNIAYINLNEIAQIQHEIESAVYSISQVNVTITNVSTIHQDVKSMIDILECYEDHEAISNFITELIQCCQEIELAKNNLIGHCVNAEYIQQNLNALLRLKAFLDDFEKMSQSLRDDSQLFLVIEKLETDLDLALCEPVPTEDLNQCTHITSYHEAQAAVAKLINITQALLQQHLNIHGNIEQIDTLLQEAYNKIALQRAKLHEQPLSQSVIEESEVVLNDALAMTTAARTVAIDLFKETGNCDLDSASKETYKSLQDCIAALGKVKTKKYYKPPTEEQIDNIRLATVSVIMKIEQEKMNSESDEKRFAALDKESQYLKDKIEAIDSMKTPDDMAFYVYAEKIRNRIQTISNRVSETKNISQSAMPTFRLHLKEFHPTTETVKSDIAKVIPDIDAMLDFLNTFHDSISRYDEDAEVALSKWIKNINEGTSILKARMANEYKQGYVLRDKAAMSILEEQLSNVPMIVRRNLSNEESQKLSTLMSKAIESQSNLINCMRNLPVNGSISINVQDFPLFEEESDVVQSINELSHQLEELRMIYSKVIKLPQIVSRPHTERISKSITAKVAQISNDVQALLNEEKGLKLILVNAETEMTKITKDSELVQSILSISFLNKVTENVSRNISMVMKLLQVPHMNANDIASFKTKIQPKLAFLISSIKVLKTESLNEYYTALDTFKSQIDTANSREMVEVCDNLYDRLINLQRKAIDEVDLYQLTDLVLDTLTITSTYTAKPPPDIRYTVDLIPSNAPILGTDVFEMMSKSIRNDEELSFNTKQTIQEYILDITKNPSKYPLYMHEVKYLSQLTEDSHRSVIVRIASILALFNPNFYERRSILEKICVSSYIRFTNEVKAFAKVLETQSLSGKFEKKRQQFLESVKECDESVVRNTQSLASISLMFTQFHVIENCLQEMKVYDDYNIKLQCYNCERWIYESDLALTTVLYGEIDCLCVKLEEENFGIASSFVRPAMLYLKAKERICCLNFHDAINLYEMLTEFCNTDLGSIESPEIHEMVKVIKMNTPFVNYAKMRISAFSRTPKKVVANSAFTHFKSDIELLASLKDKSPFEIAIEFKRLKSYVDEGISAYKGTGMKETMLEIRQIQSMIEAIDTTINTNPEMVNGILPILIPHLDAAIGSVQSRGLMDLPSEEEVKPSLLTMNPSLDMIPPSESPLIADSYIPPVSPNKSHRIRSAVDSVKEIVAVIPRNECIDILNAESASLVNVLAENNGSKEKLVGLLNKRIPQIAAVADIVMEELPEKAKSIINTDSKKLIDLVSQVEDPSINELQLEYVKLTLESSLTCFNAVTSKTIDINGKDSVVALYQSVLNGDAKQATKELYNINAVRAFNIVNGIEDKEMDMLSDSIAEVSTRIMQNAFDNNNMKLEVDSVNMKPFVDVLIKSRQCPLDMIYSSNSEEELVQLIHVTMESFNKEVSFILSNELDGEALRRHFSYISSFSFSIFASVLHNITMHNIQDIEIYQDLSSRINQIVSNIQEINNQEVTLKRRLRSINRMINASALFFEINETEQKKGIEKASLDMLKAISNAVIMALGIKATMDSIIIEEVSNEKLKPFMNQIEHMKVFIRDTLTELLAQNTDEGSGEVFSKAVEYFIETFDSFIKSKSIEDLLKVSEAANLCTESVTQLSDAPIFKPDVERADMIPREFAMPPPVIADIYLAAVHVESAVAEAVICIDEMKTADIMVVFPRFLPAVMEAVQYCIAASHEATSLQMQRRLTNCAASIVSDMSQLFAVLRSRYMADSREDPLPFLESIAITLGDAVVATREASEVARGEEREHSEAVVKYTKILKHLQSALKTVELSVTSLEQNEDREWTQPLFKVCSLLINSTVHAVLRAKEGALSERTDDVLNFAYEISAKVMEVCADTYTAGDVRQVVAKAMEEIADVIKRGNGIEGLEQVVAETEALRQLATKSLNGSVKKTKSRKHVVMSANVHLLERLHYESRVIKARMELERSELLIRSLE